MLNRTSIRRSGFTIVELLIVIVVIGILASITIVAFRGIQNRAHDTTVQSDLRNMATKLRLWHVDAGRYPNVTTELSAIGFDIAAGSYATSPAVTVNVGYCNNANFSGFAIFAMSKSGQRYYVTESSAPRVDTTGTTWNSGNITVGDQCTAAGYQNPLLHGYVSTDTAGGPWRAWVGGSS